MLLRLPAGIRPVVCVECLQVGVPEIVFYESQFLELGNSKLERPPDFQETSGASPLRCFRHSLKKSLTKWVILQSPPTNLVSEFE